MTKQPMIAAIIIHKLDKLLVDLLHKFVSHTEQCSADKCCLHGFIRPPLKAHDLVMWSTPLTVHVVRKRERENREHKREHKVEINSYSTIFYDFQAYWLCQKGTTGLG